MPIEEAHEALLKQDRLQFDLPDATASPAPPEPWSFFPTWGGSALGWVIVAVACLLALAVIWHVWRMRAPAPDATPVPDEQPVIRPSVARATLDVADSLAAQGRFAEATHALLACGIDEIGRRYPSLLRPATTSRDIAGLPSLPAMIRTPFARIAAIVEMGIFGDRPVEADSYADCRLAFVTSALAGRA